MKKLLLSLGALSAVVAPVAAVVACSSDKDPVTPAKANPEVAKDLFANDVKAYQALNLMAWSTSTGELKLNTMTNPEWVGPTEVKQPVTTGTFDSSNAAGVTSTLTATYNDVKAIIKANESKISLTLKNKAESVITEISKVFNAALKSADETETAYKAAEVAITAALDTVVFDKAELAGHSSIEVTTAKGGFTAENDVTLDGVDKQIFETGLPLLLKIVKTLGAVKG